MRTSLECSIFLSTNINFHPYVAKKWKGHVFCTPHLQRAVNQAAIEVIESKLDVKFNPLATDLATYSNSRVSHIPTEN